jgi:DNA-binding MurR/RpiR family transcriptional regulator
MQNEKYFTKKEIYHEFGLSKATFYRLLRQLGFTYYRKLLSPSDAEELRRALRSKTDRIPSKHVHETN